MKAGFAGTGNHFLATDENVRRLKHSTFNIERPMSKGWKVDRE
jgi:hypothetical protein